MAPDARILDAFSNKTVLVVGDAMMDKYIWGAVTRISPEAPVPIVEADRETFSAGGAANAAANIAALGGSAIIAGVIGADRHGDMLAVLLQNQGVETQLIRDARPTTTKVRVMAHNQQLLRCDYESTQPISASVEQQITLLAKTARCDAIIVSDYAKGVVTQSLFNALLAAAKQRGIPLLVDHKPKSRVDCTGATVIKLNHKEACDLAGAAHENGDGIARIGSHLSARYKSEIIVTRAEKGVSIFSKDGRVCTIQTKARRVADVSGAGDTFLAALTLALVSGANIEDAVHIGNHAAGIKVGKVGAVPVTIDELRSDLQHA